MSELETQFKEAAERVKTLEKKPDNETLLKLYALYKQVCRSCQYISTLGCTIRSPS